MDCEELLLSGRCVEERDMANTICMIPGIDCSWLSAVVEAICMNGYLMYGRSNLE